MSANNNVASIATSMVFNLTGWTGRRLSRSLLYIINLMTFSIQALREWLSNNRIFDSKSYITVVQQIIFTGVDALPTIILLGLATGFVFTYRLIAVISSLGAAEDIVNLLVTVICLGIAPFLSAIILISRTGSAIVVDIGNMKLHGEITGLEMLGININDYLIAPRIIGCAISQLVITVFFTIIAMVIGIVLSGLLLSTSYFDLLITMSTAFTPHLLLVFITKNLLFGFIIATTACYNGLSVFGSATEIPQRTTRAIVDSLVFIFIIDGLLALAVF